MSWVIVFCSFLGIFCLMVGALGGMAWEQRCAENDAREDRAEAEADEYIGQLRPLPGPAPLPGGQMAEAIRRMVWADQQRQASAMADPPLIVQADPDAAAYWRQLDQQRHEDQALALVRDDLTDSAYTADMAARTDRFIEYVESLARVPYSADELWSGQ